MSQRSRKGRRGPLGCLAPISSAGGSARTEHVINSCIGAMLQERWMDPQAVRELAQSDRGEPGYFGSLADKLSEVLRPFARVKFYLMRTKLFKYPAFFVLFEVYYVQAVSKQPSVDIVCMNSTQCSNCTINTTILPGFEYYA